MIEFNQIMSFKLGIDQRMVTYHTHCLTVLLFDLFGFNETNKSFDNFNRTKQLNPS